MSGDAQAPLFDLGLPPARTAPGPGGRRPTESCRKCAAWLGYPHDPACPWTHQMGGRVVNGHTVEWDDDLCELLGLDPEEGVPDRPRRRRG